MKCYIAIKYLYLLPHCVIMVVWRIIILYAWDMIICCILTCTWVIYYFCRFFDLEYSIEVESSRTSLASRTHFEVLGLKDSSPWPWPRSLKSSKIGLSSARGQHYFLNSWNFVGKRQKPRGKFANTFFVFLTWSIGIGKGMGTGPLPRNWNFTNDKNVTKKPIVSSVSVSF